MTQLSLALIGASARGWGLAGAAAETRRARFSAVVDPVRARREDERVELGVYAECEPAPGIGQHDVLAVADGDAFQGPATFRPHATADVEHTSGSSERLVNSPTRHTPLPAREVIARRRRVDEDPEW